MRSLVTGGAGFIGSHLVDALVEAGDSVLVVDDLSSGSRENLSLALEGGAELLVAGLRDEGSLGDAFASFHPDRVFHLAAQIDVRRAVADPLADANTNVLGTIALLEAARDPATVIVLTSTGGAIYGEGAGRQLPFDESADCRPEAPYGMSKLAAEGYLSLYGRLYCVPGVSLRLGNVYGPRQDPHGEAGVVAIFSEQLLSGATPTVFGDGQQTRDYVYVGDVVDALLAATNRLSAEASGVPRALNVGTGLETPVMEIADRLATLAGREALVPRHGPARAGEIQRSALDCSAAKRELGWEARTGLDEGLKRTLAYVRERSGV